MATISRVVTATSGGAKASVNVTINYTVSNTDPTATTVTATTQVNGAVSVSGGTSMEQTTARISLSVAAVTLAFGGQGFVSSAVGAGSTTYTHNKSASVAKGHSATTSPLVLTGGGSTTTVNISIPVKTSYTVTYNANSGSGAPSNQTKWHGETLAITSGEPKKAGYTFRGWSTTAARAGTADIDFVAGQNYTVNQGLDLYAVWELTYQKPTIYNVQIDRCQQDGTRDADGGYALVNFNWGVFNSTDTQYYGAPSGSETPYANNTADSSTATVGSFTATPTLTATGGTAIVGDGSFDADTPYDASISLTDSQQIVTTLADHTTTVTDVLAKAKFPIDINEDATAIAFLSTAPDDDEGVFCPDMTAQEVQDFVDNLEGGGGSGTADRVIEQGTDGIWTYRKWSSGIAEIWGIANGNVPQGWSSAGVVAQYPFSFSAYSWSVVQANYQISRCYLNITSTQISIQTYSDSALTNASFAVELKGRWK